jgi:hypothetical protein
MIMKYILIIGFLITSYIVSAKSKLPVSEYSCYGVEHKIENIKERQRKGYKSQEGERLRTKLRELKELREECKKKKIPTE